MAARISVDSSLRCAGEITSFQPDQTSDFTASPLHGRRWVDVQMDGLLSRIGSWTTPLRSAMYRAIVQYANLVGYFPGEDGRDATTLANAFAGGQTGSATGIDFGEDEAPGGGSTTFSFANADSTSKVFGKFASASTTAGWQLAWSLKLAALPGAGLRQMMSWRTSNGYHWAINLDSGVYNIKIDDASGTNLIDSNVSFVGFDPPDQWVTFRMKATASGGTVTYEFAWYREGSTTNWGVTDTFSGTVGALSTWTANGNSAMVGAHLGHVYGVTTGADDLLSTDALAAFVGYVGERAGVRFARLLAEEGILWNVLGDPDDTIVMGRQAPDTLIRLLQEIADTDQCLIYDNPGGLWVQLRTRVHMYGQTPIALAYPTHIAPPLKETYDYVGVANLVTVSNRDGGEATVALASGPMSTEDAPDGIGEKKRGVDVNVFDESDLASIGAFVLAQGTIPGPRYQQIVIDLDAVPAIASTVNGIDLGDLIALSGRAENTIYLLVIGIEETVQQKRRVVTFTCAPGDVFAQVAEYDETGKRYDLATSTLKTTVNSSATSLTFRTTDIVFESWGTTSTPYDVMIAGERLRVTAMGAASLVSGAYDQTATVTRSINGIVKSLTAGEEIHIATPGRYGL